MNASVPLHRRQFVQLTMAGTLIPLSGCAVQLSPFRFLTSDQAMLVEAICERLIPADEDPGAAWAGVVHYIDRQLIGFFSNHQETYQHGLRGVEESARALYDKPFLFLSDEEQDEVLAAMERNTAPGDAWENASSASFFNLMLDHALQGFYGDPRHGGNKQGFSYRMLGVPHPPIRARRPPVNPINET
jgi:gluconate 2-dehydrogenase gamma chain